MKTTKSIALLMTGAAIGMGLSGPAAHAVAEFVQAQRMPHPIYVDGQQVPMASYAIGGHNYVKLRDIGQAVGFEVYWDGSAARIISNQPYTGQPPTQPAPSIAPQHSAQADPSVFTDYLTESVYDTIREAVTTRQTTPFSSTLKSTQYIRWDDKEGQNQAQEERKQINAVLAALGPHLNYELVTAEDGSGYLCQVKYSEVDAPAAEHTKGFIDSLSGLSEREKIKRISWYVCDRIAYDKTCYVWPNEVLAQDGELRGACMSFAYSFQFLCNQAGIPCVFKHGGNHQWNTVYAESRWWDVDVSGDNVDGVIYTESGAQTGERSFDGTDDFREQFYVTADRVLRTEGPFPDEQPEITRFAQEVLVPGSTR